MRTTGNSLRTAYYDRNPTRKSQRFKSTSVVPAADTTRWTYTVPTARKAILETGISSIIINTVATTPAKREMFICLFDTVNRTDGTYNANISNVAGGAIAVQVNAPMTAYAGESLEGHTADASTGGTVDYDNAANIIEFDA